MALVGGLSRSCTLLRPRSGFLKELGGVKSVTCVPVAWWVRRIRPRVPKTILGTVVLMVINTAGAEKQKASKTRGKNDLGCVRAKIIY